MTDTRPTNCRNRLRDEGKRYPKSGCKSCSGIVLHPCPHEAFFPMPVESARDLDQIALDAAAIIDALAPKGHYSAGQWKAQVHLAVLEALKQGALVQPAPPEAVPTPPVSAAPADLRERCGEILAWKASGILTGEALRALAGTAPGSGWDAGHALSWAESKTAEEAMRAVIAAPVPQVEPVRPAPPDAMQEFARRLDGTAAHWKAQGRHTCELGVMPIPEAEQLAAALRGAAPPPPSDAQEALTAFADALECFWNASIGAAQGAQDFTALATASALSEGFTAVATRMREHAAAISGAAAAHGRRDQIAAPTPIGSPAPSSPVAGDVGVKPQEWHKSHMPSWNGDYHTVPTGYTVRCADENGWKWSGAGVVGYARSPDGAMADVGMHHANFVRSCLVLTPQPIVEPVACAVPAGWKLVPIVPTEPMVEAHFEALAKAETVFADVPDIWNAMLAAPPSAPIPEVDAWAIVDRIIAPDASSSVRFAMHKAASAALSAAGITDSSGEV